MCKRRLLQIIIIILCSVSIFTVSVFAVNNPEISECTTFMVGKDASADGSVMISRSDDGNRMSRVDIFPAMSWESGKEVPMLSNRPKERTVAKWEDQLHRGYDLVGMLPMPEETYKVFALRSSWQDRILSGMNEKGVAISAEYVPMQPLLANGLGVVAPGGANHWTTSMIQYGLMKGKTAREVIQAMGWMAEEYGFHYYLSPGAGIGMGVADKNEAWYMECFGPGFEWTPDSGEPGAVWVAQRVPDDHIFAHANRARIGEIDLDDTNYFMGSSNIYSLAEKLGLWDPREPFSWREVYEHPETSAGYLRGNTLRVWGLFDKNAPSIGLKTTGDPAEEREFPFSVKPDNPLTVLDVFDSMRYFYEGTEFDTTEDPAWQVDEEKSPLARPDGLGFLPKLIGVGYERAPGCRRSTYVFVAQLRNWLPDQIASILWLAQGPSFGSVFQPIYAGATAVPDAYSCVPDWKNINRTQNAWNVQLVHYLAYIRWQEAIEDIMAVYEPAEAAFVAMQPDFEKATLEIFNQDGAAAAEEFITEHNKYWMQKTYHTTNDLVDFLLYKYVYEYAGQAPPSLPRIFAPGELPLLK